MRTTGSDIGTASIEIWDSGKHIANTAKKSYVCWERDPGHAEITGREENTSTVDLTVESSQVYFIHQHSHMGLMSARNTLELISEEKGRELIKQCTPPDLSRCWDHPECRSRPAPLSPSQR